MLSQTASNTMWQLRKCSHKPEGDFIVLRNALPLQVVSVDQSKCVLWSLTLSPSVNMSMSTYPSSQPPVCLPSGPKIASYDLSVSIFQLQSVQIQSCQGSLWLSVCLYKWTSLPTSCCLILWYQRLVQSTAVWAALQRQNGAGLQVSGIL